MSARHDDNDGSDIFWPGYVDATTNLVLNLLFLLTIMTVAVFMFALELGRTSKDSPETPPIVTTQQDEAVVSKATTGSVDEIVKLKLEIQRLNQLLSQRDAQNVQTGGLSKSVEATSRAPKPLKGLDKALTRDFELVVRFKDDAITFTPAERALLQESLQPIIASEKTSIYVEVPAGFSEAKRMGFYRAMAVRNLMIELDFPKENIDVAVVEGKHDANASIVMVGSH